VYWSPRKLDPDQLVVQSSVELPQGVTLISLRTGGKWAALPMSGAVLLADLEANVLWQIPRPAGHWADVLAVTDSELLLADSTTGSSQELDELVRYDLSKLSEFAEKVP
jgi:hypothetical protein